MMVIIILPEPGNIEKGSNASWELHSASLGQSTSKNLVWFQGYFCSTYLVILKTLKMVEAGEGTLERYYPSLKKASSSSL